MILSESSEFREAFPGEKSWPLRGSRQFAILAHNINFVIVSEHKYINNTPYLLKYPSQLIVH